MNGQIFISYRREDSSASTGRLYDRLSSHFASNQIFVDVALEPGVDFIEAIEESVGACDVLIAVIGRHWLISSDKEGKRRLDSQDDFVRIEIATALKRNIRVIPVLVEGASMPLSRDLPDDLKPLVRRNAIEVSHTRFNADLGRLITALAAILQELPREFESASISESSEFASHLALGRRPRNEAKMIFIGRGGVGKTCLVNRLVNDRFNIHEKTTEGISITQWDLKLNRNEEVKLNIWDFGGQEIMQGTHQFFLTKQALYVLVLAGREGHEDQEAEYWLKLIESFGGDSPVVMVLNKIDQFRFDINRKLLSEKYKRMRCFIETDCETRRGIEQLMNEIAREVDHLDGVRAPFPIHWFDIKERLSSSGLNYLRYEEFCRLCAEMGEKDEKEQDSLARTLHTLGIALNFRDEPRIRDYSVLNPKWVTGSVYAIINSKDLADSYGELHFNSLTNLWPREIYPEAMYGFLLDLMRKFELCFPLDEASHAFLVPALLGKQEPLVVGQFNPRECLGFEYRYRTFLPEGLLPRFIVRTYVHSSQKELWRTGLVLHFEGNRALVRADIDERRIEIRVDGIEESRRRLLAIVRAHFEVLHKHFGNLKPEALVPIDDNPGEWIGYDELLAYEAAGEDVFKKVIGGALKSFSVSRHLGAVDLEGQRSARPENAERVTDSGRTRQNDVNAFISYSHMDERFRAELDTHLTLLQRQRLLDVWHDRRVEPGQEWNRKIHDAINKAQVVILLVSAYFVSSKYCYEEEMQIAMKRNADGKSLLVWVPVRDCDVTGTPFAKLQAATKDARPISSARNRDTAWKEVSQKLRAICERLKVREG